METINQVFVADGLDVRNINDGSRLHYNISNIGGNLCESKMIELSSDDYFIITNVQQTEEKTSICEAIPSTVAEDTTAVLPKCLSPMLHSTSQTDNRGVLDVMVKRTGCGHSSFIIKPDGTLCATNSPIDETCGNLKTFDSFIENINIVTSQVMEATNHPANNLSKPEEPLTTSEKSLISVKQLLTTEDTSHTECSEYKTLVFTLSEKGVQHDSPALKCDVSDHNVQDSVDAPHSVFKVNGQPSTCSTSSSSPSKFYLYPFLSCSSQESKSEFLQEFNPRSPSFSLPTCSKNLTTMPTFSPSISLLGTSRLDESGLSFDKTSLGDINLSSCSLYPSPENSLSKDLYSLSSDNLDSQPQLCSALSSSLVEYDNTSPRAHPDDSQEDAGAVTAPVTATVSAVTHSHDTRKKYKSVHAPNEQNADEATSLQHQVKLVLSPV